MKILKESYELVLDKSIFDTESDEQVDNLNAQTVELLDDLFGDLTIRRTLLINGNKISASISDAIESVAIKEGIDVVKFDSGNYGFVAYYGNKITEVEVLN